MEICSKIAHVSATMSPLVTNVNTVKFLNIRTPKKICCNHPKILTKWLYHRIMRPEDADGMANSVDPEKRFDLGLQSTLFAQTYPSKNFGSLQYC